MQLLLLLLRQVDLATAEVETHLFIIMYKFRFAVTARQLGAGLALAGSDLSGLSRQHLRMLAHVLRLHDLRLTRGADILTTLG